MKHEPVLIRLTTLVDRMLEHMEDSDIAALLGLPTEETPVDEGDPECGVYQQIKPLENHHVWWEVSWPEHVTHPRYNSDANYLGMAYQSDGEIPESERHRMYC